MRIPSGDPEAMVNHHQSPIARMVLRNSDDPVSRRMNWSAIIGSHVHTRVECAFSAKRIQSLAKTVCDMAHHRPDCRRVGGVCEAHRGEKMEAAAGNRNH